MNSKVTFLLVILIGLIFTGVAVFMITSSNAIDALLFIIIFGILGPVILVAGIYKLIQNIICSSKEKKALYDGMPTTGVVSKVTNAATTNVNGHMTGYYFITISFNNDMGEQKEYTLANQYNDNQTAYLIKKDRIDIMVRNDVCALTEEFPDEIYDMDIEEVSSLINGRFKKYKTMEMVEATEKAALKIGEVSYEIEKKLSPIITAIYIIFGLIPTIGVGIFLVYVAFNAADMVTSIVIGVFALLVFIASISTINRIRKGKIRRR